MHRSGNGEGNVRFGSEADILGGLRDVRFTPESRHKEFAQVTFGAIAPPGFATLAIHCLGQGQVAPELLQMRGHDCPSEGLRPLWRVEPDLERDRDSRQHTTQHNDLERRHCPWAFGPRPPHFLERKNYARVPQRSAPLG